MRIRIWNAFASNNSGSYVIVGGFPTTALAQESAAELLEMAKAHSLWRQDPSAATPSPMELFAHKHGLLWKGEGHEEWPGYSEQAHPAVWTIGHQVFVHSDYTVSMPSLLGHFIYARGGRVETEINHAHHPIVAVMEMRFPWQKRNEIDVPARVQDIVDDLCAEDGPLTLHAAAGTDPAWHTADGFGEAQLTVGAVFRDLCASFSAVSVIATKHGALISIRLFEAWSQDQDAVAFLRPCAPRTRHPLVDVVLVDGGLAPTEVAKTLQQVLALRYNEARQLVDRAPVTLLEGVSPARARDLAARLAVGLAKVDTPRSRKSSAA